ncbi:MAG: hypothetical protein CL773_00515 [Chloroflexi bacterium]|nr:hypothetical protein [Chloroflexota bacterium]|tara:strand:+ start:1084 stop:1671 length:588 start_codon:yes stop_codon:yes gene_type:complete
MNIKNLFRDKTRDIFHKKLLDIDVDCSLSERGIVQEKLFNPWHRSSLGIILINSPSLIKYINIVKHFGGRNDPSRWWFYFAVPSETSDLKKDYVEVKSIRKKTLPIIGSVKSVYWEKNENGKILAEKFTNDLSINSLSKELGNIKIQSLHEDFSGYSIELEFNRSIFPLISAPNIAINKNHWDALNKIAKFCIES